MRTGNTLSCKPGTRITAVLTAFVSFLLLLVFAGCGEDVTGVDVIPIPRPPSPANTFKFLADAYENRDLYRYETCFAEGYVHIFPDGSAGWGLPEEDSLSLEGDLECARRLFQDKNVTSIEADFAITAGPWPTEAGIGYRLEPYVRIEVGEAARACTIATSWGGLKRDLGRDEMPGEACVYIAFSTWLDVEVVEDEGHHTSYVITGFKESFKTE